MQIERMPELTGVDRVLKARDIEARVSPDTGGVLVADPT